MEQTITNAPAQPKTASLTSHYVHYALAYVLSLLGGFISFPIMVRLLTQRDMGILGYFEFFSLIWVAVLKLGTQHSIQRFYAAHCLGRELAQRQAFYATFLQAPAFISSGLFLLSLAVLPLLHHFFNIQYIGFLYVVLFLGQIGVVQSLIDNLMKAREQSGLSSTLSIIGRYLQLALALTIIYYYWRSAAGAYLARIIGSLLIIGYMTYWAARHCEFNWRAFSPAMFRESLAYGLPLVFSEISFTLLAFADRFMLKQLHYTFADLGVYTIGYAFAMYVGNFFWQALSPAFQPMANRLYEHDGLAAVLGLERRLLRALYYAAAGLSAGVFVVGKDLLLFVAGQKNVDSTPIFQWVSVNYLIFPIFLIMAYGLNLLKRTRVISLTVFLAAIFNIALNLWMIPRWGIMGAVYATLVSYVAMGLAQIACCPRAYRPTPATGEIIRPLLLGGFTWAVGTWTNLFGVQNHLGRLLVMAVIFTVTFVLPALILDRPLRRQMLAKLRRA